MVDLEARIQQAIEDITGNEALLEDVATMVEPPVPVLPRKLRPETLAGQQQQHFAVDGVAVFGSKLLNCSGELGIADIGS